MQEIKQIIKGRIKDIIDLQKIYNKPEERHRLIIKQRYMEINRNCKQMKLLDQLQNNTKNCQSILEQMIANIKEISILYHGNLDREESISQVDQLGYMVEKFFNAEEWREKFIVLKSLGKKQNNYMIPNVIFSWLSQWSRKRYLQILNSELKCQNKMSKVFIHQIDNNQYIKNTFKSKCINKQSQKILQQCQIMGDSLDNLDVKYGTNKKNLLNTQTTIQSNRLKTISHCETTQKILTIYNKPTLYGYIIDELSQYYQLTQIMGLDKNYMKSIRKKKLKQYLMTKQNQKKIAQVLIQCSGNKQIKNILKQYQNNYKIYKQQHKYPKQLITKPSITKKIYEGQSMIVRQKILNSHKQMSGSKTQKIPVDDIRLSNQTQPAQKQSILEINSDFIINQHVNYRIHKLQTSVDNIKMKFPNICKSFQKDHKKFQNKQKFVKWYDFEEKQFIKDTNQQQQIISNYNKYKLSQRQTIKGIIIKNFLSTRNKADRTIQQQINTEQRNELILIKNPKKGKISLDKMNKIQKIMQSTDIRSLKQKTNAILKNFKNYQYF